MRLLGSFVLALMVCPRVPVALAQRQLTFDQVKAIAVKAVNDREFEFDLPKIVMDEGQHIVYWDWGNFYLPANRPIDRVVRTQAQLEVFRVGCKANNLDPGWLKLADKTEEAVKTTMLPTAYDRRLTDKEKITRLKQAHNQQAEIYSTELKKWADKNKWRYIEPGPPAGAYTVTIRINPPTGRIKIMHVVPYNVAKAEGQKVEAMMDNHTNGAPFTWSGYYMVLGIFGNQRFGPIKKHHDHAGTYTIFPDRDDFQAQ